MQFSQLTMAVAMILETILGCAYLAYSLALIKIGANLQNTLLARVFVAAGIILFLYVFLTYGGFSRMVAGVSDTSVDK